VLRDNQLRLNQFLDEMEARFGADGTYDIRRPTPSDPWGIAAGAFRSCDRLLIMAGRPYPSIEKRFIARKILLDEARLACALERFRLAHGHYPDALPALVPEFMPDTLTDVYAGGPYHYVHASNDSFRLYSVGENELDDSGVIMPGVREEKQLDAIWLYAPPASP
jgi:hypothetical protein